MKIRIKLTSFCLVFAATLAAQPGNRNCQGLPTAAQLKAHLQSAANLVGAPLAGAAAGTVGGLFNGTRMWGAVVNRDGEICAYATSTDDPSQVWPGSQAIA